MEQGDSQIRRLRNLDGLSLERRRQCASINESSRQRADFKTGHRMTSVGHMRKLALFVSIVLAAAVAGHGQQSSPSGTRGSVPDLSGVWMMRTTPETRYLLGTFMAQPPPMTAWAEERMKLNRPSFGPQGVTESNDPVNPTTGTDVGCFLPGVPRIYLHAFPMEIIQTPGRVLIVYE